MTTVTRFYREGFKHRSCGEPLDVVLYWRRSYPGYCQFRRIFYSRRESHHSVPERPGDYCPRGLWENPPYSIDRTKFAQLDGLLQHYKCGALLRFEEAWIVSDWCADYTLFQGQLSCYEYPKLDMWEHFNLTLDRRS